MIKRWFTLSALALAACAKPAPTLGVDGAWVRLAAVPGRPGAAYFTLRGGSAPARLVAVASERAATVELHASKAGMHGMAGMTPLRFVDVPAGGAIAFAPGGRHAMLYGVKPDVAPGTLMPLAFRFADGTRLVASAKVVAAGDAAPAP